MFTVHDSRHTGMPTLGTLVTAEAAWDYSRRLGIADHAVVLPYHQPTRYGEIDDEFVRRDERRAASLELAMEGL